MSQGEMSKLSGVSAHSGDFENLSMQSPFDLDGLSHLESASPPRPVPARLFAMHELSGSWITSHGQSLMWSTHELIDHVLDSEAVLYEGRGEALAEPLTVAVSARR